MGYTFEALVYMRLLRMMRDNHIGLQRAVETISLLKERFGPPSRGWERARIFADADRIWVDSADAWQVTSGSGQRVHHELFGKEFARLKERADALLVPRRFQAHVEIDPSVRSGLPVVRGTSIPTVTVFAMSYVGARAAYPHLTEKSVRSAIDYERYLDRVA